MPFDAELTVNANERFMRVRNLIAELPAERFDYNNSWDHDGSGNVRWGESYPVYECQTNLCILGWARVLYGFKERAEAFDGLGLTSKQGHELFFGGAGYSRDQALRTMDHLAATGIVDWTV